MSGAGSIQGAQRRWAAHCESVQSRLTVSAAETPAERQMRIRRAQRDYRYFVEYYLPHYATAPTPDFHVKMAERVARERTIKGIVRWGRGLAKSVCVDIAIPLWLWIRGEDMYMVVVGNTEEKAAKLLGDLQVEFESNPRLIADFGEQTGRKWTETYFVCRERFTGVALGMGQEVRGLRKSAKRPNYIVCDDLEDKDTVKNPKRQDEMVNWILQALIPTMDGPVRRFLDANNNFAPRTIQSELEARNPDWWVHRVDASVGPERLPRWEGKYPKDYYQNVCKDIGVIAFEAEYNNTPWLEGKVFTQEHIDAAWRELPPLHKFEHIVGRWDPAYSGKNDYNAVKVWGLFEHRFYLIGCFVRQRKMNDALAWMYDFQSRLPGKAYVHWRVESQFWNDPMRSAIDDAEKTFGSSLNIEIADTPKVKKIDRLLSMFPYYENRRIHYNEALRGDADMIEGIRQLLGIEPGYRTHDDSPDADERAVADLALFDKQMAFRPVIGRGSRTNSHNSY